MAYQGNKPYKKKDFGPKRNEYIRVPQVQLIDDKGGNIGVTDTDKARAMAKEAGLDLVEVGANAKPPVCKIMDYSKYVYQQNKKKKGQKSKAKEQKEFKFSPVIDTGDMNHRIKRAKQYLDKGHPVKLTMQKKGRQSMDQAKEVFTEILTNFEDYSSIETEPKYEGRRITITFKSNGKTKNKQNSKKEN
jgi:translation initiation factor IF-3